MNRDALTKAWLKIYDTPPPEALPPTVLSALEALLPEAPYEIWSGYTIGGMDEFIDDPWPQMLVGRQPQTALRNWVVDAAGILEIGHGPNESWLVVDTVADDDAQHRVYRLDAEGREATLLFASLDALLHWIAAPEEPSTTPDDDWDRSPDGLQAALDLLWALHPADLFQRHRGATWSTEECELPPFAPLSPAWRRSAIGWTLAQFHNTKVAATHPQISPQMLDETHVELIDYLKDLEEAVKNEETPVSIVALSVEDDEELSANALNWMARFERARERTEEPKETSELAAQTKALLTLLQGAVEELVRLEHIEVNNTAKLVERLLEAVMAAGSPEKSLRYLIDALMESSQVEEVYADDAELTRVIARALGMPK